MVTHGTALDAVHAQSAGTPTLTVWFPPTEANVRLVGVSVAVQKFTALCCVIVTVRPATESVPVRGLPAFAAMLKLMLPEPTAGLPGAIVIHATLLVADHVQSEPSVTVMLDPPAAAVSVWIVEDNVAGQKLSALSCFTVTVPAAAWIVAERPSPELTPTVNGNAPVFFAVALESVIHGAVVVAAHEHPGEMLTPPAKLPPVAGAVTWSGVTEAKQLRAAMALR